MDALAGNRSAKRTKRRLIPLAVFAACWIIAGWLVLPRSSAICKANYDRLVPGMTLLEVEDILGGASRDESTGTLLVSPPIQGSRTLALRVRLSASADETWRYWSNDAAIVAVCFDQEGCVSQREFTAVYREFESPWAKLRRWLRL